MGTCIGKKTDELFTCGWGQEARGSKELLLMVKDIFSGAMTIGQTLTAVMATHFEMTLKITELYTLNGSIVWYVNYISKMLLKKKRREKT